MIQSVRNSLKTFNEKTLFACFIESDSYYIIPQDLVNSVEKIASKNICKLGCYLTYKQASILVDYADPEYETELTSLITIHDIIPKSKHGKNIDFDELSTSILPKQQV